MWGVGAQRGVHKQLRLSTNSNASTSASCPVEVAVGAGHSGGCLWTWGVQKEDGLAWPQQPGPWGPCSEEQTHKSSTESPFPPTPPSSPWLGVGDPDCFAIWP